MTVDVAYIGGSGRSGSTLLARIIGQLPGFVTVGEVREVWRAGVIRNESCGCGQPFAHCSFWQRVGQEAFGGWARIDPEASRAVVAAYTFGDALRYLQPGPHQSIQPDDRLADLISRLYRGISAAAEGATIVDTSKGPAYAVALSSIASISIRAIHLVRDSRGVAYSWSKEVPRPYSAARIWKMHRLSALAAARWVAHNSVMELLGQRVPASFMRYESVTEHPTEELTRALGELGYDISAGGLDFMGDDTVRLKPAHVVSGNPMRLATGALPFHVDAAWRRDFPKLQQAQVTAMTWPMLLRYGYRLQGRESRS